METGSGCIGVQLSLLTAGEGLCKFTVNSSPVLDEDGVPRGAMATFDDVTELERRNDELQDAIAALQQSQQEVNRQNEKLQILATRDPLTSCLNRRSLYEHGYLEFEIATRDSTPLACIMMDVDYFKSVNDTFGHSVGDEVLRRLADTVRSALRTIDLVGRYGGEEFCILLPGLRLDQAAVIAERLRKTVAAEVGPGIKLDTELIITSSFGVSSTELGAADTHKLVDEADKALYAAKQTGRNRVKRADQLDENQAAFA
jgi:diguanylate cyclase (GGDEF)-like protein